MRKMILALAIAPLALTNLVTLAHADDKQTCNDSYQAAQSLRLQHKLIESRDQLRVCTGQACADYQQKDCSQWFGELQAAVPSVVLSAKDGDGNSLTDVTVTMDGQPFASKLDGTSVDVDPGNHAFSFTKAGQTPVGKQLLVVEGQKDQHVDVTIGQPTQQPAQQNGGQTGGQGEHRHHGSSTNVPAWIAVGVGGVGIILGGVFGAIALGTKSTLSSKCNDNKICPASEQSDINSLSTSAIISDIGFGVGIVGIGIGTYLFLSHTGSASPDATTGKVHVTPYFAGNAAGLTGSF